VRRALLAAALAAASGCALSVETELPDVEVTRHGVAIPGVPIEVRTGDPVVSVPVTFNPRDHLTLSRDSYHSVKVQQVTFKSDSAGGDLSFVRILRMTIVGTQAAASGGAPIEVLRYQRDDSGPVSGPVIGPVLDVPLARPVEILPAWNDPPCVITLEVQGALPEDAWSADVTVHLSATVGL
jgi:hypothetical protein